jgi:hypothetical protein
MEEVSIWGEVLSKHYPRSTSDDHITSLNTSVKMRLQQECSDLLEGFNGINSTTYSTVGISPNLYCILG